MKTFRITAAALLILVGLLGLSVMLASAQRPDGDSPSNAIVIDNQAHVIPPHTGIWFRFDYDAVDRAITTITLINGNNSGVRFEVWTPEGVTNTGENKPVGRGTTNNVNCNPSDPSQGTCQTNDLIWVGAFATSGTYYVQVVNDKDSEKNVLLTINGSGVSLLTPVAPNINVQPNPPVSSVPPNTNVQPNPPASPAPQSIVQPVDDPNKAVPLDSAVHTLPPHSATWFRFDYATAADPNQRTVTTIVMVNAKDSGVRFEVWTPDHVNDWWDNQKPVGRGTVYMVDCGTGQASDTGQCQSNDLTWIGSFNMGGTYYVRVVNDNDHPSSFALTINSTPMSK